MQRGNSLEKTPMLGKIKCKRRRQYQRMRWLDSIMDSTDMNVNKLWDIVEDREAWCANIHRVERAGHNLAIEQQQQEQKHIILLKINY